MCLYVDVDVRHAYLTLRRFAFVCVCVCAFVLLPDQLLLCCVPVRLLALMCASVDACFLDKHIFLSMQATCWSSSLRGRALILVVRVCVCGIRGLVQAGSQRGLFGMF